MENEISEIEHSQTKQVLLDGESTKAIDQLVSDFRKEDPDVYLYPTGVVNWIIKDFFQSHKPSDRKALLTYARNNMTYIRKAFRRTGDPHHVFTLMKNVVRDQHEIERLRGRESKARDAKR